MLGVGGRSGRHSGASSSLFLALPSLYSIFDPFISIPGHSLKFKENYFSFLYINDINNKTLIQAVDYSLQVK